ncbi:MAG: hypothetical protein V7K97_06750 [Nostoc sp.]
MYSRFYISPNLWNWELALVIEQNPVVIRMNSVRLADSEAVASHRAS